LSTDESTKTRIDIFVYKNKYGLIYSG